MRCDDKFLPIIIAHGIYTRRAGNIYTRYLNLRNDTIEKTNSSCAKSAVVNKAR